ncbi:MAG: blue light sensor protein [Methylophaga sp.]|nr:blue light sensor protein [Methylophaga sp.]
MYQILSQSGVNNKKSAISGALCFNGDFFLQCPEGGRAAVNELYRRIHDDHRHLRMSSCLITMKSAIAASINSTYCTYRDPESLILRYAGKKQFNPYEMSGESALRLGFELAFSLPEDSLQL